jgi:hypothetical protein
MSFRLYLRVLTLAALATGTAWAGDTIPKAAWRRPLGLPLVKPGITRVPGNIDDGFWQGAPVGGFGSGTFSRTYRGDFARWHIKAGVHKYAPVYANQFAMFQQTEGEAQGTARVLMTDHPTDGTLASWQWDYPVGAGEYAALYPKSWYDYKWDKFPAHVVSRIAKQLSRIKLSGCRLSLACGKSHPARGHRFCSALLDEHGRLVSYFYAGFSRCAKSGKSQSIRKRKH